ncbi:MAG: metallophosphoesterase family protein [Candidatus Hydrogenedentes bacterium]|nr:metallophosphoesterase family protein [Candidatus Hydrogenedentota bacterium]
MRSKFIHYRRSILSIFFPLFLLLYSTSIFTYKTFAQTEIKTKTPPLRETKYPVTQTPSQIALNITKSPSTSISISWSTSTETTQSIVEWRETGNPQTYTTQAKSTLITDLYLTNNPQIFRWYATLENLTPNTQYEYRVGEQQNNLWSEWFKFKTAPKSPENFSFIYLGDAQNGFEEWGKILKKAVEKCPQCSFIMLAGDLVNRGNERDDWDEFFYYADNIFAQYPLVPAIGNHEYKSSGNMLPQMYLDYFTLPENGPDKVTPEFCYSFNYSNSKFIILNGSLNPLLQVDWLEQQLEKDSSLWRFLMFHQPIYSSAPKRDNKHLRDAWLPVIDKYHVDIVFQGHDHSYWRTHPLKNGEVVTNSYEGTVYVISFSGTKAYDQQEPTSIIAKAFSKIPTYQIITIETQPENTLTYRSFDLEGNLKDEFVITKPKLLSWGLNGAYCKTIIDKFSFSKAKAKVALK